MTTKAYDNAVSAIDTAMAALSSDDRLRLLALACGFALSTVRADDRQKARDQLVERIDAANRHAVVARCDA
jgi:hypothetical protein